MPKKRLKKGLKAIFPTNVNSENGNPHQTSNVHACMLKRFGDRGH